jgi:hypothetical protein
MPLTSDERIETAWRALLSIDIDPSQSSDRILVALLASLSSFLLKVPQKTADSKKYHSKLSQIGDTTASFESLVERVPSVAMLTDRSLRIPIYSKSILEDELHRADISVIVEGGHSIPDAPVVHSPKSLVSLATQLLAASQWCRKIQPVLSYLARVLLDLVKALINQGSEENHADVALIEVLQI